MGFELVAFEASFATVIVATGVVYALPMGTADRTRIVNDIQLGVVAAFIVGIVSQLYGA